MFTRLVRRIVSSGRVALQALTRCLVAVTRPAAPTLIAGALADLTRSKPQVVAQALLIVQPDTLVLAPVAIRCILVTA